MVFLKKKFRTFFEFYNVFFDFFPVLGPYKVGGTFSEKINSRVYTLIRELRVRVQVHFGIFLEMVYL